MTSEELNAALAKAITAFVFAILALAFLLPTGILWGVYALLRNSPSVSSEDLLMVRNVYFILVLVFGSISFLSGVAALILHHLSASFFAYEEPAKNGRYQAGKLLSRIAYPLGLLGVLVSLLLTTLSSLSLYSFF